MLQIAGLNSQEVKVLSIHNTTRNTDIKCINNNKYTVSTDFICHLPFLNLSWYYFGRGCK